MDYILGDIMELLLNSYCGYIEECPHFRKCRLTFLRIKCHDACGLIPKWFGKMCVLCVCVCIVKRRAYASRLHLVLCLSP